MRTSPYGEIRKAVWGGVNMKGYATYKESGIPWVGKIPSSWKVIPNKKVMSKKKDICERWNGEDVMSLTMNGVIVRDLVNPSGKMPATFDGYQFLEAGDLLMCLFDIDVTPRCIGRVNQNGVTSPAYSRFKLNPNYDVDYYYYYYLMMDYSKELLHLAKNIRHSFTEEQLGALKVPCPPYEEQRAISKFLDKHCVEIDTIIEMVKNSIEEYKKWKASIISEVVMKGLDKNKKMKMCDLEWMEEIPYDWNTNRLKLLFAFGKGLPITKADLVESGIPVISYGQIHAKINPGTRIVDDLIRFVPENYIKSNPESLVSKGDILIADTSEDIEGCGNAVYIDQECQLFAGYHTIILKAIETNDNRYLAYLFKTDAWRSQIRQRVSGVKLFSVSKKILNFATVILPTVEEQEKIVEVLDSKCKEIDSIIREKENLIKDLESYKRSLIYETITGKRKVI